MTPQEAIDYLNMDKNIRETCEADDSGSMLFCEALKVAISALEKQIPKETVPTSDNVFEFGNCPNCNSEFNTELIGEYEITNCPYCGQALDLG